MNDRMYGALVPVRWTMLFLMLWLTFIGGTFCPAVTISPVLAGLQVSLFAGGFMMVIVLTGSFFRDLTCCLHRLRLCARRLCCRSLYICCRS